MYLITGREILEGPYPYPIQRLPVFKVTGREVRVGEKRYRFGLVRFAKDAVRMKNLWRSSAAEWLAMAPRQQWLLHAADKDEANRYRNAHKSGDTVHSAGKMLAGLALALLAWGASQIYADLKAARAPAAPPVTAAP
jgi:hypothetical protein